MNEERYEECQSRYHGVLADPKAHCSRASLFATWFQIDLVRCARNAPHLKISGEKRI
jgi:hypothetical protein